MDTFRFGTVTVPDGQATTAIAAIDSLQKGE